MALLAYASSARQPWSWAGQGLHPSPGDLLGHELQGASLMNGGETSRPLQLGLKFIWPNALNQSFHMELLSAHRVPGAVPGVQPQQSKD